MSSPENAPDTGVATDRIVALERSVSLLTSRLDSALTRLFEVERMAGGRWLIDGGRSELAAELMLDELTVPMTMRLSASQGLHRLEYDGEGRPFRWTGPSAEFGFNGYVSRRRSGVVKLNVLWGGPTTEVGQTRCFVDDEEIILGVDKTDAGWSLSGVVPPRGVMRMSAFRFIAPEVFRVTPTADLIGLAILGFSYRLRAEELSSGAR